MARAVTDGQQTVSYVADDSGRPTLAPGSIWQPVAEANRQAWQEIDRKTAAARALVTGGRVSCLHYYMTANQMDLGLLAGSTGQARWRVWLHLRPWGFRRLARRTLERYAALFQVRVEDLREGRLLTPTSGQSSGQTPTRPCPCIAPPAP